MEAEKQWNVCKARLRNEKYREKGVNNDSVWIAYFMTYINQDRF